MPKLYLKNEILVQTAKTENLKPRQHVIDSLLNYSKALEVTTMRSGKKVVLNMN